MKTLNRAALIILNVCAIIFPAVVAHAAKEIGSVTSAQGIVTIERSGERFAAAPKSGIILQDVISTAGASSMKALFSDGSTMTLGENTTVVVKDFISENREKSLFDLLEGRVHVVTVTGNFRVNTPTAVVAVQGGTCAVIESCKMSQERCVRIITGEADLCDTALAGCRPLPAGTPGEGITVGGQTVGTMTGVGTEAIGTDVCWGDYCQHGGSTTPSEPPGLCATCPGGLPASPPTRSIGIIDLIWP